MQAIKIGTEAKTMTAAQSLTYVKTLLQAGLGCITFLRGLLPEENFIESKLASGEDGNLSFSNTASSQDLARKDSKRGNGITVMTIRRRFTEEADSLLNFLENGIFDALEKHYLRSFIFAIYVDRNDPTNIIEAYTFNFNYYKMEGSDESVPVMTLGDELGKLSLRGHDRRARPAPTKPSSKAPSTEEVKRTLQKMVRTLIVATTNMENLPKTRYATFKLFYTENAPDDYEPPFFRPGDNEKDQWTFGTHDGAERPEKLSVGKLQTPWHGVDINIASVTSYLPALPDKSSAGKTTRHGPNHTQEQVVSTRKMEAELLQKDAEKRRVIWAAEPAKLQKSAAVGERQDDVQVCASSQFLEQQQQEGMEMDVVPLGIRNDEGTIVPIPPELLPGKELVFGGVPEKVPSRVGGRLTDEVVPETQTQQLVLSPSSALCSLPHTPASNRGSKKNTTIDLRSAPNASEIPSSSMGEEIDTQLLLKMTISQVDHDQEMNVDEASNALQTAKDSISSMSEDRPSQDEIRSFSRSSADHTAMKTSAPRQIPETRASKKAPEEDNGIQCECGLEVDDAVIFCEGECKRWYHVWCMGYHSTSTKNLPAKFICFDCRLHKDANWDLIQHDLYPQFIIKYNALSLFRRAIKIVETVNPSSLSAFARATGCDVNVASQLWNRLESDGFIVSDAAELAEIARSKKAKKRFTKRGKKYTFRPAIKKSKVYQDHFMPSPVIEDKLMGLSEMVASRAWCPDGMLGTRGRDSTDPSRALIAPEESQTQEETQLHLLQSEAGVGTKRKPTPSSPRFTGKRVKISLGEEVDLCD